MSSKVAFTCDVCGAERKETNHWFVVEKRRNEIRFSPWPPDPQSELEKHVCGQACAHKLLDEFMSGGGQ